MESHTTVESPASSMGRLPPEILHMIFSHLEPQDVTKVRLVCNALAQVGLHYLIPSYHLIFKPRSFERLLELSQHPILRQCVKSIYYEADQLEKFDFQGDWEVYVIDKDEGLSHSIPWKRPLRTDSQRDHAAYRQEFKRWEKRVARRPYPRFAYTKQELSNAYVIYKQYLTDQAIMRRNDYNAQIISDAMRGLPNLKSLSMSIRAGAQIRSDYIFRAFSPALQQPYGDRTKPDSCGANQLRSLLLGAQNSGLRIEHLCCGEVHWRFFRQDREISSKLQKAARFLQSLEMHIATTVGNQVHGDMDPDASMQECATFLSSGAVRAFATAASELNDLIIKFDDYHFLRMPARLVDIVGSFRWNSLRRVHFSCIGFTQQDSIAFYKRHCETLKDVGIDSVRLEEGDWASVFQEMAKTLCLEKVAITGYLHNSSTGFYFGYQNDIACDHPPMLRRIVEGYILHSRAEEEVLDLRKRAIRKLPGGGLAIE